ncbi:SPO22-domain-containing protein [Viridothelium virens]|uniref:SPO22-domain-containing protein n=1 Tax=Viridothelium virens TaxID=1048519 RepID=A0A6A6H5W5_VIRVR|nr:SPO22-domain-containing protein [Viridothelium virens]
MRLDSTFQLSLRDGEMVPPLTAKKEKEAKLKGLLSFADSIPGRVESSRPDAVLIAELGNHVHHTFSALGVSAGGAKSTELDSRGTKIWNLSTRLRRDDNSDEIRKLSVFLRVFAVLMVDAAQQSSPNTPQNSIRLLKVSLKAARTCLENEDTALCLKVLEKAAHYESELGKPENQPTTEDDIAYKRLSGEYFIMRTALAWKQSRLDLAEHMFEKTARLQRHADPATAERLADVLYEMGKDLLGKKQIELAGRWLERAYDILAEQDLERLSSDAGELRLSIMHSLARAFLVLKTAEARVKVQDLVRIMENDFGHKLVVSMLKLELLSGGGEPDAVEYATVLMSIVRTIVLTEASFKTILHHIHKLKDVNAAVACKTLDEVLELRLYEAGRQDWLEKAVVMRIWLTTAETNSVSTAESAHAFLQNVFGNLTKPFTLPAAHAVMTLLWKRIEAAFSQLQYEIAEQWCNIAHHQIFQNSGDVNLAIIARKGIQCGLARQDEAAARKMFFQMPLATRAAPQTRYLMYKVAMRGNDMELASECLEIISRSTNKDATLLYACVLEAQQNGNRQQAIVALQQTLAKLEFTVPHNVHVPALLRCTARLILAEFTSAKVIDDRLASDLCSLFEGASFQAKRLSARQTLQPNAGFTKAELEWFSKNAYNFALKHCTDLYPRTLLRLLRSCSELLELLRTGEELQGCQDLLLRLSFCHFLAASASITLARAEDQVEQSAQQYLIARNDAARFCELFAEVSREGVGNEAYEDLQDKRFELLRFQLECAVRLGSWNELDELLDECVKQDRIQRLEKLADLVFSIHSALVKSDEGSRHQSKLLATIQKIVRLSWQTADRDIVKVSRWLRCLFAMALGFDTKISLVCLDEAKQLVRQGVDGVGGDEPYPAEEIEWLASMAFNRSVDCFCASDDDGCRLWAEKALGLAKSSKETESLYTTLQSRYSALRWDGQE